MTVKRNEFLLRGHPKNWGELNESNYKSLKHPGNVNRLDPAIRDIVLMLNEKGYTTVSSCSGGHSTKNIRKRFYRHDRGYILFAPASRIPVELFFRLREDRRLRKFMIGADLELLDYPPNRSFESRLRWDLEDGYDSRKEYYYELFSRMKEIISTLPNASRRDLFPATIFGKRAGAVSQIQARQQKLAA